MGKFIVVLVFSVAICWGIRMFVPGVSSVAFHVNSWGVTWTLLLFIGSLAIGFKLAA